MIISISTPKNINVSYEQLSNGMGPLDSYMLEIVQHVLLSSQENINFIHEIFRQSYLMSGENGQAASLILRRVTKWIQVRAVAHSIDRSITFLSSGKTDSTGLHARARATFDEQRAA